MSTLLLLAAVVLFAVKTFGGHLGNLDLISLGLMLFAASFLVGPITTLIKRAP